MLFKMQTLKHSIDR